MLKDHIQITRAWIFFSFLFYGKYFIKSNAKKGCNSCKSKLGGGGAAVNPNPFAVALGTPTVSLPSVCGQESENKQKWKMRVSCQWQGSHLKAYSPPCVETLSHRMPFPFLQSFATSHIPG